MKGYRIIFPDEELDLRLLSLDWMSEFGIFIMVPDYRHQKREVVAFGPLPSEFLTLLKELEEHEGVKIVSVNVDI